MSKFDAVVASYKSKGVKDDNIDYVVCAIKDGTKREFILESLIADYRGMNYDAANQMLDDFYKAYGGEFKNESRGGYLIGSLILALGLIRVFIRIGDRPINEILDGSWDICLVGGISILITSYFFIKAFRGTFREKDSPLN